MNLLFLGDSITDCNHSFTPDNLGCGYVRMIYRQLSQAVPGLSAANKGIDGFTVTRVHTLWQGLPQKEQYDLVSLLVGVNDVGMWMDRDYSSHQLFRLCEAFAEEYEDLVTDFLDRGIPRVILMEPFIFQTPEKYLLWRPWLQKLSASIQKIARTYRLTFLPLQKILDQAAEDLGSASLTTDGIHLTVQGNRILTEKWLEAFPLPEG